MTDQNQPEIDLANAECGDPVVARIRESARTRALQGVADAANAGEGEPFTTAAQQLVAAGHLRVADGFFTLA